MDELEFRRRVYACPNTSDRDVLDAAKADPSKQQFLQDTRALDDRIKQAMEVPVSSDFADKLIWQSTMREHARQKKRARLHIAMAASFAFAIGLTFALWSPSKVDLGNAALAHMHYAQTEKPVAAIPVTLDLVNEKLVTIGAQLNDNIGSVYVANYCQLDNMKSLHLIIDSDKGPISVFFLPHSENSTLPERFSNDMYEGKGFSTQRADIMVVGNKHSDMTQMSEKVRQSLIRT